MPLDTHISTRACDKYDHLYSNRLKVTGVRFLVATTAIEQGSIKTESYSYSKSQLC